MDSVFTPLTRVLVVDDHQAWRRRIRAVLEKEPQWRIVAEVLDGMGAVRRAAELRPDIILLDVQLPGLNGIAAARHILDVSPQSKILFLSESRSREIVEAALGTG